jgi:glutamate dehydrogenase (NAD(P)+)
MEETFRFVDDLGPAKIIHVSQPSLGLRATLVVDNVARGPSIGGLRMAPDVSTEECFRLARATLKNSAADAAHAEESRCSMAIPRCRARRRSR